MCAKPLLAFAPFLSFRVEGKSSLLGPPLPRCLTNFDRFWLQVSLVSFIIFSLPVSAADDDDTTGEDADRAISMSLLLDGYKLLNEGNMLGGGEKGGNINRLGWGYAWQPSNFGGHRASAEVVVLVQSVVWKHHEGSEEDYVRWCSNVCLPAERTIECAFLLSVYFNELGGRKSCISLKSDFNQYISYSNAPYPSCSPLCTILLSISWPQKPLVPSIPCFNKTNAHIC